MSPLRLNIGPHFEGRLLGDEDLLKQRGIKQNAEPVRQNAKVNDVPVRPLHVFVKPNPVPHAVAQAIQAQSGGSGREPFARVGTAIGLCVGHIHPLEPARQLIRPGPRAAARPCHPGNFLPVRINLSSSHFGYNCRNENKSRIKDNVPNFTISHSHLMQHELNCRTG